MDTIKKALVVGGSSDIGKELINIFLEHNYTVISASRSDVNIDSSSFTSISGLSLDSIDDLNTLEEIAATSNPSSVAYLPGMIDNLDLDSLTTESLIQAFTCNLFGYWMCIKACKERMKERNFGRFCSVSSIGSKFGGGNKRFSYTTSKKALEFFPREFKDLGKYNIFVNNVVCGVTDTKMLDLKPEQRAERAGLIPIKRLAKPNEIALELFLLCSDRNTYRHCSNTTISGGE